MTVDWTSQLFEQLDWHWRGQLRPRLNGLTDDEYFWEPVPGCWTVRPREVRSAPGSGEFTVDFSWPAPDPPPVTTIAWRLVHLITGVLGMRAASHFGGPAMDYDTFEYAGTAKRALAQLDAVYRDWSTGVRRLTADQLAQPCGKAEGAWSEHSMAELILHINREAIHHGAEIALLRDLYRAQPEQHSV